MASSVISLCYLGTAGFAPIELFTFGQEFRIGGAMNAAISPPPKRELFAALTIASTFIFVMSFLTIWSGIYEPPAKAAF